MVRPIAPVAQTFPAVACKTSCFKAFHRHNCAHVSSGQACFRHSAARARGLRHPAPASCNWTASAGCGPDATGSSCRSASGSASRPGPGIKSNAAPRPCPDAANLHRASGNLDSSGALVRGQPPRAVDESAFQRGTDLRAHDPGGDVCAANRQPARAVGWAGITPRLCTANDRRRTVPAHARFAKKSHSFAEQHTDNGKQRARYRG